MVRSSANMRRQSQRTSSESCRIELQLRPRWTVCKHSCWDVSVMRYESVNLRTASAPLSLISMKGARLALRYGTIASAKVVAHPDGESKGSAGFFRRAAESTRGLKPCLNWPARIGRSILPEGRRAARVKTWFEAGLGRTFRIGKTAQSRH